MCNQLERQLKKKRSKVKDIMEDLAPPMRMVAELRRLVAAAEAAKDHAELGEPVRPTQAGACAQSDSHVCCATSVVAPVAGLRQPWPAGYTGWGTQQRDIASMALVCGSVDTRAKALEAPLADNTRHSWR